MSIIPPRPKKTNRSIRTAATPLQIEQRKYAWRVAQLRSISSRLLKIITEVGGVEELSKLERSLKKISKANKDHFKFMQDNYKPVQRKRA